MTACYPTDFYVSRCINSRKTFMATIFKSLSSTINLLLHAIEQLSTGMKLMFEIQIQIFTKNILIFVASVLAGFLHLW